MQTSHFVLLGLLCFALAGVVVWLRKHHSEAPRSAVVQISDNAYDVTLVGKAWFNTGI